MFSKTYSRKGLVEHLSAFICHNNILIIPTGFIINSFKRTKSTYQTIIFTANNSSTRFELNSFSCLKQFLVPQQQFLTQQKQFFDRLKVFFVAEKLYLLSQNRFQRIQTNTLSTLPKTFKWVTIKNTIGYPFFNANKGFGHVPAR